MNKRKKRFSSIHLVCLVLFVCILLGLAVFNAENLSKSASEDDLEVSSETQESSEQESSAIEESKRTGIFCQRDICIDGKRGHQCGSCECKRSVGWTRCSGR